MRSDVLDLLPLNYKDGWENTEKFLMSVVEILLTYVKDSNNRKNKLVDFYHPDKLLQILDLAIPQEPRDLSRLLADCSQALQYQVKTGEENESISLEQVTVGLRNNVMHYSLGISFQVCISCTSENSLLRYFLIYEMQDQLTLASV